jgi:hypothetical protein
MRVHEIRFSVHEIRFFVHEIRFSVHEIRFSVHEIRFPVHEIRFPVHVRFCSAHWVIELCLVQAWESKERDNARRRWQGIR